MGLKPTMVSHFMKAYSLITQIAFRLALNHRTHLAMCLGVSAKDLPKFPKYLKSKGSIPQFNIILKLR